LEQAGKGTEALAHYRQAAQVGGCDPAPFLLLGATLTAAGDLSGARQSYERALAIDPQDPDVQFASGANSLMAKEYADAVQRFSRLAAQRPQMMIAHYYLGSAYEGLGEQDKAQAAYAEAVRLGEQASDAAPDAAPDIHLAFAYEKTGRIDDAIALYVRLLTLDELPDVHAYLGSLYAEKGALDLARREYERAVALDPGQGLASFALANLAYAEGDFATAAKQYEAYLAIEETASIRQYAGEAYLQLGDLPNAYRHLKAAADADPGNAELAALFVTVANWLNRLDDAETVLDGALRLRPDDPGLYFNRAQLAYKRCRPQAAVADMQRAVSLQPQNSLYIGGLGGYLSAAGEVEQMQVHLEQLMAASPDDYIAHWMAGILLTASDQAAAQAAYRRALSVPDLPPGVAAAVHVGLGHLAFLREDMVEAGEEFAAAVALAPDYIDAEVALGDVALLAGDTSAATEHYGRALEGVDSYAAKYSYDNANLLRPALHARLALAARRVGDEAEAAAALARAHSTTTALRSAAPNWPGLALLDALLALLEGQASAADEAFARAVACDATYATAREQIEMLVERGQGTASTD
jgi:tetratricopeptide (TPR) repeat protein